MAEEWDAFTKDVNEWYPRFSLYIHPSLEQAAHEVLENLDKQSALPGPSRRPPVKLPATFPLRELIDPEPDVETRDERAAKGLPPLRNPKGKPEMWIAARNIQILLPSSFDARLLKRPCAEAVVGWERDVRTAEANDGLDHLRSHIITSASLQVSQKVTGGGKAARTRLGSKIQSKYSHIVTSADFYRRARIALVALGMAEDDVRFPPLRKSDATKFTITSDASALGQSRKNVSWIWNDFSFHGDKSEKYQAFYDDGKPPITFT